MPRRWLLTILAVVTVTLIVLRPELRYHGSDEIKPETFTVTTGGTRVVAQGRAQLWLSRVDLDALSEDGQNVPAAEFELTCNGKTFKGRALVNETAREFCGCRVRLVEVIDTDPPSVRFEVSTAVSDQGGVQAASQFVRPSRP